MFKPLLTLLLVSLTLASAPATAKAPANVPLPTGPVVVIDKQCPAYAHNPSVVGCAYPPNASDSFPGGGNGVVVIYLQPGLGRDRPAVLHHEIGHAFDYFNMNVVEHAEWGRITHQRFDPERFAETYRMCFNRRVQQFAYYVRITRQQLSRVCTALWRWQ